MRASIRKLGNSSGVIIPKPLLAEIGVAVGDDLDMTLEEGRLVLVPAKHRHPRAGWAKAAKEIAAAGDDGLVWPEFGNTDDKQLQW